MKPQTGLLITIILAWSCSVLGDELKSDRKVLIIGIERHENDTDTPYKVEATTSGSEPTLYYKLACKSGGADLSVGHVYKANEETDGGVKTLWIYYRIERDPSVFGVVCDVKSVKVGTKGSRG